MLRKLPIALLIFIGSCGTQTPAENHDHNEEGHTHSTLTEDSKLNHDHTGEAVAVQLNDGKKWEANPETITGIKNMQNILLQKKNTNTATAAIAEPLQKEFNMIFEKCTMTGEAHNQLHNYLVPVKDYIVQIKAGSPDENIPRLESYLKTFYDYFE